MSDTIRYYGYFDAKSKAYVKVFPDVNDATAARTSKKFCEDIVKQDKLFAQDLETHFLFTFNQTTGEVTDNKTNPVFIFVDYINELNQLEAAKHGN